jgi:hypothetical protein
VDALRGRLALIVESERRDFDPPDGRWSKPQSGGREAARLREQRFPLPHAVPRDHVPARAWRLAERARLSDTELFLLLIAAAPLLDVRLEHTFDVLNSENASRTPTVATALRLAGLSTAEPLAREILRPDSPLASLGLLEIAEAPRPLLGRRLTVPDRVTDYLCGSDTPDGILTPFLRNVPATGREWLKSITDVEDALDRGRLLAISAPDGSAGAEHAHAAITGAGLIPHVLDARRIPQEQIPRVVAALARESSLGDVGIIVAGILHIDDWMSAALGRRAFLPGPIILVSRDGPSFAREHALALERPHQDAQSHWWIDSLARFGVRGDVDPQELSSTSSRLDPSDIDAIVDAALRRAGESTITQRDVVHARLQAAVGSLEGNARLVTPAVCLNDLVLDEGLREQLNELRDRARLRNRVLSGPGVRVAATRGRGVTAMFCGPSGSGKTFAAEAIAGELGLPLFVIDVSQVIDKYIGETEKRLETTLTAIERYDGVLLFDEGDAIFGTRSEVKDARDRYANVEVAYLLQRMESFEGLAIVTTNMRANVDSAFLRRFDMILEFTDLNHGQRRQLWRAGLCDRMHVTDDEVDDFATTALTAGAISSAVTTAGYLAAADGSELQPHHVRAAIAREWRKFGRLPPGFAARQGVDAHG